MSRTNGSGPAGPSRVQPSLDAFDDAALPTRSDWPSSSSSSSSSYGKGSAASGGAGRATSSTHTIVPEHALEDEWADEEPDAGAAPPEAAAASHPAASGPADPEDYWEDESSSDEDSGSSTHAGRAYRQSRRALARSRSQSLFASIDGSAEPEEHGSGWSDAWRDEDEEEERRRYDRRAAASAARRGSNTTLAAASRAGAKQADEASLALHSPIARHPPPPSSSSSATTTRPRSPSLFLPPPGPLPSSNAQARAYSRDAQTEGLGIQPAPEESTSLATPRTVLKDIRSNSSHSSSYAHPHTGGSGTGDALGLHGLDLPAPHQQPSIAPSGLVLGSEKSLPASSLPPPLLPPHSSTSGPAPAFDTPYSPAPLAEAQPPSSSSRGANRSPKKGANAKLAGSSEPHAQSQAQAQTGAQQSANTNGLRSPRLEGELSSKHSLRSRLERPQTDPALLFPSTAKLRTRVVLDSLLCECTRRRRVRRHCPAECAHVHLDSLQLVAPQARAKPDAREHNASELFRQRHRHPAGLHYHAFFQRAGTFQRGSARAWRGERYRPFQLVGLPPRGSASDRL